MAQKLPRPLRQPNGTVYTDMGAALALNDQSKTGVYWVRVFGAAR